MNKKRKKLKDLKIKQFHARLKEIKVKPEFCEDCGIVPPRDLANISQKYLPKTSDYKYLCRSCHQKMDHKNGKRKNPFSGLTPWNKGKKTGIKPWLGKKRSKETIDRISKSCSGRIPWNKGLKGWTKGTKAGFKKGNIYGKYPKKRI